jgi:hypothetical protein
VLPNSVTTIGAYAFCNTKITGITLPSTTTNIGGAAFANLKIKTLCINSFGEIAGILSRLVGGGFGTGSLTNFDVVIKPTQDDTTETLNSRVQGILSLNKSYNAILSNSVCALDLSATSLTKESCLPITGDIDWQFT